MATQENFPRSELIALPDGEVVKEFRPYFTPIEVIIDHFRTALGDELLPSSRRSFQFAERPTISYDPRDGDFDTEDLLD